jgi:hypothetical protein
MDDELEDPKPKHVLTETNYCATMYEHWPVEGRYRCTAAGRYMTTDGRVVCARCASGLVVAKLTKIPRLLDLVDRLIDSKEPLTDDMRAALRLLVGRAEIAAP